MNECWDTVFADSEDMKDGVCAYFFKAVKSDCNGYIPDWIDME